MKNFQWIITAEEVRSLQSLVWPVFHDAYLYRILTTMKSMSLPLNTNYSRQLLLLMMFDDRKLLQAQEASGGVGLYLKGRVALALLNRGMILMTGLPCRDEHIFTTVFWQTREVNCENWLGSLLTYMMQPKFSGLTDTLTFNYCRP